MKASSEGHVECVKLLLDKGAHIDLQDMVSACHINHCLFGMVSLCRKGIVEVACVTLGLANCVVDANTGCRIRMN